MSKKSVLYSAIDDEVIRYEINADLGTLERCESVRVPAHVQYACPHPSGRYLYLATSNRGPGLKGERNHVCTYRIDPVSGKLTAHGEPRAQYTRAVHICTDPAGKFLLSAHNLPRTGLTVNPINADGTIGEECSQRERLDYGHYPHQVLATPSGRAAVLVDRGNDAEHEKPEDPGALRVFSLKDGQLSALAVSAPNWGYGFGPRHVDFHPAQRWLYASLERQNQLQMFELDDEDRPGAEPNFIRETLADPKGKRPRQLAGAIHVHPDGKTVYVINRSDWKVDHHGGKAFGGGENSIAVFAIDQKTGAPELIQHASIPSFHVRTFAIDLSHQLLVTASVKPMALRRGGDIINVPASLAVFRIAANGKLHLEQNYDIEIGGRTQYWMGIVGLQ